MLRSHSRSRSNVAASVSPQTSAAMQVTCEHPVVHLQLLDKRVFAVQGTSSKGKRIVICGGGVIGASTAYYLSQKGCPPVVVERESIACAASGKAGGFLALDWNDNSALGPLSRKSYELHRELATSLGQDIGYRAVDTLQVMGQQDTTAQVHPKKLTEALMSEAQSLGARLLHGCVEGLVEDDAGITGVIVDGKVVDADIVVLALGPWTSMARNWLPVPSIHGQKYHSVVVRPPTPATAHCLFTSISTAQGRIVEPEIYPRPDGTIYVCGEPQSVDVPSQPCQVSVDADLCSAILRATSQVASSLDQGEILATQACFLPMSPDGMPVIGPVASVPGAFIATGHTCWGILNGPATGLALAELILDGVSSINLQPFDPARFDNRF